MPPEPRTRFAPSPTGPLHLGHAFSALTASGRARALGGQMLLRIEDIDRARCRPEWEAAIFNDLQWLGLSWPLPVMRQSDRAAAYAAALARLAGLGVLYPCTCTRGDIRAALSAPQGAVPTAYPGTCRGRPMPGPPGAAIRLDLGRALQLAGAAAFTENGPLHPGRHRADAARLAADPGDVVLARRDIATSYHLAVVVDDAAQGITEVVRGDDLFAVTPLHAVLQILLELRTPSYWHHKLILDSDGKRLAKRDDARALSLYRAQGVSPEGIRKLIGI